LVALNFAKAPATVKVPAEFMNGRVLLSTAMERGGTITDTVALRPMEGLVMAPGRQ
jgi:hypothetical protein